MGRERENDRLPPQALTFIVWSAITHLNFLTAPRDVATVAGRDAWLATLLSFGLVALGVWLPLRIVRLFPGKTIVEVAEELLGRPLGALLTVGYAVYWLLVASWLLLVHSHLVMVMLLPETPRWVLNVYLLLISTYLVRHGLEPMARLFVLTVPAYLFPLAIAFLVGAIDADLGRLRPVLGGGFATLARGTWLSFAQASGMSIIWMVGPYLTRFRGAVRSAMLGVALIAGPAVVLVTLLLARLGPGEVAAQLYPPLIFIELLEVPGFTGFHLNTLFLAVWIVTAFTSVALLQYAAAASVRRLLRLPDNRWPVLASCFVLIVLSNLPVSEIYLLKWAQSVRPYSVGITALGIPTVLWVLVMLRGVSNKRGGRRSK